ncbi:MAG: bifunctional tetrahydrofolate synthase/dihydrofolate synthase [Candidatus Methylopumilus sp.]
MPESSTLPTSLTEWLAYIEALHPKSIAMGLDRVNEVKNRLNLYPDFPIIIVAGTNGKGSTCAMLERIYHEAGYRVASYSSPHLLRYNERVRVACQDAQDEQLVRAFSAVELARKDTQLTYFEYGTLAAMWLFIQSGVDVAILEVGLGGRLDAVNAFEPSCAIVTSIDIDHIEFLGNSRESIGIEKAGVFRQGIAAICGDPNPPQSLIEHANSIGAELKRIHSEFNVELTGDQWVYSTPGMKMTGLPVPALVGGFQLNNAACAITAVAELQAVLPVKFEHLVSALNAVRLAGRFQCYGSKPPVILDVAHNPHAAQSLALNLSQMPCSGRTLAVFGMLADKDMVGVIQAVGGEIDSWYVASIENVRGAQALQLLAIVHAQFPQSTLTAYQDVTSAFHQACLDASENDRIVVLGSFFTVADVMRALPELPSTIAANQ